MSKKKAKADSGWTEIYGGMAFIVPVALLKHENFTRLSAHACKLLLDLGRQYTGSNNGYLHAGMAMMKGFGWASAHTLTKAIRELEHYNIIEQTRMGGKNRAAYYALTFRKINTISSRPHDRPVPVGVSNSWQKLVPDFNSKNSFVHDVHKVSAPRAQVAEEFVH